MVKATDFLKVYEFTVRVKQSSGNTMLIKTTTQASSSAMAKRLGEAQYGKGSVVGTPREIKLT
jgi:hypothetical protein